MTRRRFAAIAGGAVASALGAACGGGSFGAGNGRLQARPRTNVVTSARGTVKLELGGTRDAILQMPAVVGAAPVPLVVLLHGAGGTGERQLARFGSTPSNVGLAVLAPDSRRSTWDGIGGAFGADIEFLDRALAKVFDLVAVDPARVSVAGFSDGATYALSLGLINGSLFRKIGAFSPGFVVNGPPEGKPAIFVSHGTADRILPIDMCSRRIVPQLLRLGYAVTFREFSGGHEVPPAVASEGLGWLAREEPR
jgi:phospholipase/carboxylesterase